MKNLGVVTIGQVPRVDLVPEIRSILGEEIQIIEKGALDGLSLKEVETFYLQKRPGFCVNHNRPAAAYVKL